ncbi:hypothetical protein BFC17_02015 [Alteromonas lipolytica]|uniref:Response regulatory domain-containing protein n=2 Tax=Alteromonas lipolytica TaxID=1856405 RepID=A0A1E8FAY4_9ALTE|nr:hypothetical protein BFC17_02015 [Alteromonas lipolytica]
MRSQCRQDCGEVLLVDDNAADRSLLKAMLEKLDYRIWEAENGKQALEQLSCRPFDMVLSDWMMPEMTGPELCQRIATRFENKPYIILITGRQETNDLIRGIESGADDFLTKPFHYDELRVRVHAGSRVAKLQRKLLEQNLILVRHLHQQHKLVEQNKQELTLAARVLMADLPDSINVYGKSVEVYGQLKPANTLGGDVLNHFMLDDAHLAFYLIDVVGHGVSAALNAFLLSKTLVRHDDQQSLLYQNQQLRSPGEVASALNTQFFDPLSTSQYFTMIYGVLNINTGDGVFCQAGSPSPVICDTDGHCTEPGHGGFPVGLIDNATFEEYAFTLKPGQRLLVFSDGFVELDIDNSRCQQQRLYALLSATASLPLDQAIAYCYNEVENWTEHHTQLDDMSMLAIQMREAGQ